MMGKSKHLPIYQKGSQKAANVVHFCEKKESTTPDISIFPRLAHFPIAFSLHFRISVNVIIPHIFPFFANRQQIKTFTHLSKEQPKSCQCCPFSGEKELGTPEIFIFPWLAHFPIAFSLHFRISVNVIIPRIFSLFLLRTIKPAGNLLCSSISDSGAIGNFPK